jgi:branched-chain amino acid transport system substrate-binding protein
MASVAACGSSSGGGSGSSSEPIVFAIQTSQSGTLASLGADEEFGIKAGVSMATKGTNKVDGREIKFVVVNDNSDPGAVPAQTRKLLQQDDPTIVFGPLSSAAALAAAPILADAKIPAVFTVAAADDLTGFSKYTFRTSRNAAQEAQMGSAVVGIKAGQSFQVLAPDYKYGQSAAAAWQTLLTKEGGKAVSGPVFAPLDARDYTAVAERVKAKKADVVVVVTFAGAGGPTLWRALNDAGVVDSSQVFTLLPQRATREAMGPVAGKLRFFAIYDPKIVDTELNKEFLTTFAKVSGGKQPDIYAGDSGVAGMLAVQAIEKAGSSDPEAIQKALSGLSGDSIKGPYEVRAEDHTMLQSFFEAKVGADFNATLVRAFPQQQSVTQVTTPIKN